MKNYILPLNQLFHNIEIIQFSLTQIYNLLS